MLMNPEQEICRELGPSERLLWCGAPCGGLLLRGVDVFLIPFSLLWCGLAIFWEATVIASDAPLFFTLWGIPFVLAGLYFVFGRFVVEARQRRKTCYGVTSERVIIVSGLFSRNVRSLSLKNLGELSLTEKADRSGTIVFGAANPLVSMFGGMAWPGITAGLATSFALIANVREVHDLILRVQRDLR